MEQERGSAVEELGRVACPSGDLIAVDFGLLPLWSGSRAPLLDEQVAPKAVVDRANAASDFEIVGRDADEVAAALDLAAVKGRYAFDWPDRRVLEDRVRRVSKAKRLRARLHLLDRVPHAERVQLLLAESPAGAEVPFHGVWGVAVRGLPTDRTFAVRGQRMEPDGPDRGRWRSVWVQVTDADPVHERHVGHVLVDEARLLFADPTKLGAWRRGPQVDGMVDVVFWGRDAATVAEQIGASSLELPGESDVYGWVEVEASQATDHAQRLDSLQSEQMKFAIDIRPHDDDYRLLAAARGSSAGAATIEVGGTPVTGWFTTWGDGAFPVYRDLGADGSTCRIRVELGSPEIVARTRKFEARWFGDFAKLALVSARVVDDGEPVRWLFRESPDRDHDSGWRAFAGDEDGDYTNDPANIRLVPLRELIEMDPELERLLHTPHPAAFERQSDNTFESVEPPHQ